MERPSRRGRDVLPCERSNGVLAKKGQEKSGGGGGGGFVKSDMPGVDIARETTSLQMSYPPEMTE